MSRSQPAPTEGGRSWESAGRVGSEAPPVGGDRAALEDQRTFLLRSIADLDAEVAAGDLDPADHRALRAEYTARAAQVLRSLEALDAPPRPPDGEPDAGGRGGAPPSGEPAAAPAEAGRRALRAAGWRSRRRLALAAIAVVVVAGLAVAATAAVGRRDPGGVATGGAVGSQKEADLLLAGEQASSRGDNVTALKDLEAVLRTDPNQVVALTDEGWILAQTQQPQLLAQGVGLLVKAERVNPAYPPAQIYLGVAYLSEADYPDAAHQLATYLAGSPDPALVPRVRQALAQARAGAARMGASPPPTTAPPSALGG